MNSNTFIYPASNVEDCFAANSQTFVNFLGIQSFLSMGRFAGCCNFLPTTMEMFSFSVIVSIIRSTTGNRCPLLISTIISFAGTFFPLVMLRHYLETKFLTMKLNWLCPAIPTNIFPAFLFPLHLLIDLMWVTSSKLIIVVKNNYFLI